MLNTVHKITAVLSLALLPLLAAAQQSPLATYLAMVESEHPDVLRARLVEQERQLSVDLTRANRRPTVDAIGEYFVAEGGRTIDIPIGDLFNPVYGTLNQVVGQEAFPTDLENVSEQFLPSQFYDVRVAANLPIVQPLIGRETALREAQLKTASLATRSVQRELRREVRMLYYAHLQATEGQRIIAEARRLLQEVDRLNDVLIKNDKITRDARYRTRAELAALDGEDALLAQQATVSAAALNRLLGRPLETLILTDTTAAQQLPERTYEQLRTEALAQRPELQQLESGISSLRLLDDLQAAERLPTIGIGGQVGLQGFVDSDFGDHPYGIIALKATWSLYDGGKRRLRRQQTQLQQQQLAQQLETARRDISLELYQIVQQLESRQMQLRAADARITAADEAYRIIEQRYRADRALLVELLQANTDRTQARQQRNVLRYQLLQDLAELESVLGK